MSGINFSLHSSRDLNWQAHNKTPQDALNIIDHYPFPYVPNPIILNDNFCIPPNPVYSWITMSAELNLFKIRNCMNIAGMKRELDPYAAPTDTTSGLPQIGANGQLVLPGTTSIKPVQYHYEFLIERAKQLVGIAQQLESNFLSLLEKYDATRYSLLKAKQDLSLSKANVKLKELQTKVAEDQVDLATLQKEKSEIQVQELDNMINAGLNTFEELMIVLYDQVAQFNNIIAGLDFGIGMSSTIAQVLAATNFVALGGAIGNSVAYGIMGGIKLNTQGKLNKAQSQISDFSIFASQARRVQEWNFQKTLATQDIKIGSQQIKLSQDGVRVAGQEKNIADLQQQNAEDSVSFLSNQFTNVDLYDWMSNVIERVYGYFLQEATGVAKLAQNQLAFERQEAPSLIIMDNYWEIPSDNALPGDPSSGPDRKGLTGSARLLQDIYRLDQYAFASDKRKLQITKTLSLASCAPMDFQIFKDTGELNFITLMDYFDRDFPGHYLRLIKKVSVMVIALVPPVQGIKGTLTSSGISRVTIGGNIFQDTFIKRDPESIILSGTRESSGVFELQQQDARILNPFEGSGVNMAWQFKLPKASNLFDFNTIADVLFKIEYTALSSYDYEKQVKNNLGTDFVSDRAFSFRNELPDAFYQWTHLDEFDGSGFVEFDMGRFDFPANVTGVSIKDLKFYVITDQSEPDQLVFANNSGKGVQVELYKTLPTLTNPNPQPTVKGNAGFNLKGIVSTLTNGGSLVSFRGKEPFGKWKIKLDGLGEAFSNNKVFDVIMIITYNGELPNRI